MLIAELLAQPFHCHRLTQHWLVAVGQILAQQEPEVVGDGAERGRVPVAEVFAQQHHCLANQLLSFIIAAEGPQLRCERAQGVRAGLAIRALGLNTCTQIDVACLEAVFVDPLGGDPTAPLLRWIHCAEISAIVFATAENAERRLVLVLARCHTQLLVRAAITHPETARLT